MTGETSPAPADAVDQRSGYCPATRTFHSLRPAEEPLLPADRPLSAAAFTLSSLPSPLPSPAALVDAATGDAVSYPEFLSQVRSLAAGLRAAGLNAGDVAFVLSPSRLEVPVLYLALLSIGVVVSPANPLSALEELTHQIRLAKPKIAFATAAVVEKLPRHIPTVLLDSADFKSLLSYSPAPAGEESPVRQSDTAAILFSSGTTGRVKGVELTHRNFITLVARYREAREREKAEAAAAGEEQPPPVALFTIPLFHVFGFIMVLRCVLLGETTVLMPRFDFTAMLRAVERFGVTYMPVSPPLVVALAKSGDVSRFDLSSLRLLACGGAPLGREVAERFAARFPHIEIVQVRN